MFKSSPFDKSLENATSSLRLEPDWEAIIAICDQIRQGDITPKYAIQAIKKKMMEKNPHQCMYALMVLESVVKNCGAPVHEEISNKANCEMFSTLVTSTPHENVRNKMLELIQTWAFAFRTSYKYRGIKDTMNILKTEGYKFPEMKESDAMFVASVAPEWADAEVCHRCRVSFSFTIRKHHCRNCGQVFCGQCSGKTSILPKFGIEKEVRVCDGCHATLSKPVAASAAGATTTTTTTGKKSDEEELPAEYLNSSLAQQNQTPARKTEEELREEEELQLALALSQSEAESKKQQTVRRTYPKSPSPEPVRSPSPVEETPTDPELARYLNRGYWEQRQNTDAASPSAPSPMPSQTSIQSNQKSVNDVEINEFSANMKTQVEIFVNRMKSNSSRGRNISTDTSVQTLFLTLTSMHSKLLSYTKDMDDKRMWYEQLQDKLTQVKDSRAALDVLRQEHQEKLRRIAEEQERQRQMQMAHKLEIMRKKKHEYLQYQRQLALQRIQEQEREMQMRQEQQKAQYLMGSTAFPFMPGNQGSPVHIPGPGHNNYQSFGYNQMPPNQGMPYGMPMPGQPMFSPPATQGNMMHQNSAFMPINPVPGTDMNPNMMPHQMQNPQEGHPNQGHPGMAPPPQQQQNMPPNQGMQSNQGMPQNPGMMPGQNPMMQVPPPGTMMMGQPPQYVNPQSIPGQNMSIPPEMNHQQGPPPPQQIQQPPPPPQQQQQAPPPQQVQPEKEKEVVTAELISFD